MSMSKHDALESSKNKLAPPHPQKSSGSIDRYELFPMISLTGSNEIPYQTPEPYRIYIDSVRGIYRVLGTDAGLRAGYECIVMLESDALFDANAKEKIKNLYLVEDKEETTCYCYDGRQIQENTEIITLLRYDGEQWRETSRRKDLIIDILGSYGEQRIWDDPKTIKEITSFYSCCLLEGNFEYKLEDNLEDELKELVPTNLNTPGLKEQIIKQMVAVGHIPEGYEVPAEKKRQRKTGSTTIHVSPTKKIMTVKKCLIAEFENASTDTSGESLTISDTNQPTLALSIDGIIGKYSAAGFSNRLGQSIHHHPFWTSPDAPKSKKEKTNNKLAELLARISIQDQEACIEYASLLLNGGEGVKQDIKLGNDFLELVGKLVDAPNSEAVSQIFAEIKALLKSGAKPGDSPDYEEQGKLSPKIF